MSHFRSGYAIFICLLLASSPINAFIGSAYRIHIKGLGTIILLGDQEDPAPEVDQNQFGLLEEFLKQLARKKSTTVVNLETYIEPEYYAENDSRNSMIRNRLSEREVAPNLQAFVSTLQKSDLQTQIIFTSSNSRRNALWNLTNSIHLRSVVEQTLKRNFSDEEKPTLLSIEQEHQHILRRYHRFLERSEGKLPTPLFQAIAQKLNNRFEQIKKTHQVCKDFFLKYSNHTKAFADQTIQDIMHSYSIQKMGIHALDFSTHSLKVQEQTINIITASFLNKIQTKFKSDPTTNMNHLPWIMDVFNVFTHHKAQTAVFYANDSRIHAITLFLKALQNDLMDDSISFETEFTLEDQPLTNEEFKQVFWQCYF